MYSSLIMEVIYTNDSKIVLRIQRCKYVSLGRLKKEIQSLVNLFRLLCAYDDRMLSCN